jgi:hypothetical protein
VSVITIGITAKIAKHATNNKKPLERRKARIFCCSGMLFSLLPKYAVGSDD